jgi:hypothetical protein
MSKPELVIGQRVPSLQAERPWSEDFQSLASSDSSKFGGMEEELGRADGSGSKRAVASEPQQLDSAPAVLAPRFLLLLVLAGSWPQGVASKFGQSEQTQLHVGQMFGDYSNDTSLPLQSAQHPKPRFLPPSPPRTQTALPPALLPEAFLLGADPLMQSLAVLLGRLIDAGS